MLIFRSYTYIVFTLCRWYGSLPASLYQRAFGGSPKDLQWENREDWLRFEARYTRIACAIRALKIYIYIYTTVTATNLPVKINRILPLIFL